MQITVDTLQDSDEDMRRVAVMLWNITGAESPRLTAPHDLVEYADRAAAASELPPAATAKNIVRWPPAASTGESPQWPPAAVDGADCEPTELNRTPIAHPDTVNADRISQEPEPAPVVELDSAGVAYDPAVHSSSKAKNKDGTWRNRRGGPAPSIPDGSIPKGVQTHTAPPPPAEPAAVAVPPPPPAAPVADAPLAGTGPSFRDIVIAVTKKNLPKETTAALLAAVGVESLTALVDRPALFPEFLAMVNAA